MKKPLLAAMLLIGVLAASMASTSASFNDTVTSSGNSFATASLPAPTLTSVTATDNVAPGTIEVAWTAGSVAPGTHVAVERATGSCAGTFVQQSVVLASVTPFSQSGLAADTYCYRVRGVLHSWTSPPSASMSAAIGKDSPTLALTANPTTADEGVQALNATASVTGGSSPTGNVTFNLYRPGQCGGTPAYSQTVALAGGSASTTPGFVSDVDGTWHWTASYAGDASNNGDTVSCPGATVVVSPSGPPPVTRLKFASAGASSSVCGAAHALRPSSVTTTGEVVIEQDETITWLASPADGLTTLPSGTYTGTLQRLANSGATSNRTVDIAIGICDDGTYQQKGVQTGVSITGSASSNPFSVSVSGPTALDADTLIVIRISNSGGSNGGPDIRLDTDGSSFIDAPGALN